MIAYIPYWFIIVLMMIGLYVVMGKSNLLKKVIGLNIFQLSAIMLYIEMGKVRGGTAPVVLKGQEDALYSNPLPHVLMLTAIVVGVATTSLALALIVRIHEAYGTMEEDILLERETALEASEAEGEPA